MRQFRLPAPPLFDFSVVMHHVADMSWQELRNAQFVPKGLLRPNGEVADTNSPDYQRWRHGVR